MSYDRARLRLRAAIAGVVAAGGSPLDRDHLAAIRAVFE
jgi:hypothetical protein